MSRDKATLVEEAKRLISEVRAEASRIHVEKADDYWLMTLVDRANWMVNRMRGWTIDSMETAHKMRQYRDDLDECLNALEVYLEEHGHIKKL